MGFHTNNSGYTEGRTRTAPKQATGCACGCSTKGPAPDTGGDIVRAMQTMIFANKIDAALEKAAQPHMHATDTPLTPRGLMHTHGQERGTRAADAPLRTQGLMDTPRRQNAPAKAADAPLTPRGLMAGGR